MHKKLFASLPSLRFLHGPWSCRQKTQSLAQEHLKRATTVSGPGFLAMEVGPLWLFLSYLAVAGFTHLMSANLFRSSHDKKQAQLPPKACVHAVHNGDGALRLDGLFQQTQGRDQE